MNKDLLSHYSSGYESIRLDQGNGKLEWLRTMEILARYLPEPPARILDIGGGPGAYALPLAKKGYEVHLVDLLELHVEQAKNASELQKKSPLASIQQGDAQRLTFSEEYANAVLLLGPLYHLTDEKERQTAWKEAYRVLKPSGIILAAGISRFASTCDGLRQGFLREAEFETIVSRDVKEGQHRNEMQRPEWFTTAYFHLPEELRHEAITAGFKLEQILAVEGPAWLLGNIENWLSNEQDTEILLRSIRRIESAPSLLGASAHLIVVGEKM